MPSLETYRKQAKLLVRWHREANPSIGGKVRLLPRYRDLTDRDVLAMQLPLTLAQEIIAAEAGFANWAALKAGAEPEPGLAPAAGEPAPMAAVPVLFVRDVAEAARHYEERLGFETVFLHGRPAFYGAVRRGGLVLHLRHVTEPNFSELAAREEALILALAEVRNIKALYAELKGRGAEIAQPLTKQAWGGSDFHVRDPDGNAIGFVQYRDRGQSGAG